MSAGAALAAVKTIYGVVIKVKDNQGDLLRLTRKLEHITLSIEDSRRRDIIREDEYNDALTTVSDLILRTQRISQRLLKRSLGDRTWHASEITEEIKRLNDDVQVHLDIHTIRTLDIMHASNVERHDTMSQNLEEIRIKLAELDIQLKTRPGDPWAGHIRTQAQDNIDNAKTASSGLLQCEIPISVTSNLSGTGTLNQPGVATGSASMMPDISLQTLIASGKTLLQISGLRVHQGGPVERPVEFPFSVNAGYDDILKAIKEAGYSVPDRLIEENPIPITVTEDRSTYDASAPEGLQIARSLPLLWWWNKYQIYHGLTHATTPGHTIARINSDGGVQAGGVTFHFHRTLRVPDSREYNDLPPGLGTFPLVPVENYARFLPDVVRERGGFIMPMFKREALWISFETKDKVKAAVKVSVGGVNAISGIAKDLLTPPSIDQDYVVAGLQPWIDGVATEPGVVRQFVATMLGQGYTVEEQVTGKAEIGGFQFDVFRRRANIEGGFWKKGSCRSVDILKTPAELSIDNGETIDLILDEITRLVFKSTWIIPDNFKKEWTLARYRRRVSPLAGLQVGYDIGHVIASGFLATLPQPPQPTKPRDSLLGVSLGGKIVQKIYKEQDSHRVYDEESGHRFYVHIISAEAWEGITGVLPPITPITRDMYVRYKLPWFRLYDDYSDHLTTASDILQRLQSVQHYDQSQSIPPSSDLIDPDDPPRCLRHPRAISSCVFRPCGHVACATCLGEVLIGESKCVECKAAIAEFVGMKRPIAAVTRSGGGEEPHWSIHEMEDLAAAAADTRKISVINCTEHRVPPLHSKPSGTQWCGRSRHSVGNHCNQCFSVI